MSSSSSASSEMGAELNSITLSYSETRKHPRSSSTSTRKLSQQPAGFPKILKKDEFSIRSKVGIISTHSKKVYICTVPDPFTVIVKVKQQ